MDPIHPILPQPVNIPPVMPPPKVGRIDRERRPRDDRREEPDERKTPRDEEPETVAHAQKTDPGEEPHGHIDVTA
jgi:hypothetical protein